MKKFLPITISLLCSVLLAQDPVISAVEFRGNEITKEPVLQREILHPLDIPLDSALAEQSRIRLLNLGLFMSIDWYTEPLDEDRDILVYHVLESFRILPAILPLYSDETGWGLLFSVSMVNFRGLNETVSLNGRIGRLTSLRFSFYDPWVYGDHGSVGFGAANERFNHSFLPLNIHTREASFSTGRYWGYKYRGQMGTSITHKVVHDDSGSPLDTLFYTNSFISGTYDTRDIYSHPTKGMLLTTSMRLITDISGNDRHSFHIYQDLSTFKKISATGTTIGLDLGAELSFRTKEPIFLRSMGGSYSVRGWPFSNRNTYINSPHRFGYQLLSASVEARQAVNLLNDIPLFQNLGFEAAAFFDTGWIDRNLDDISGKSQISGVGFGIRVNFPVIQVIRLDYGWGIYQGEITGSTFHLGFGQKF